MRTKLMLTILLPWFQTCAFGAAPASAHDPMAMTIIVDASGSCGRHMPDFASLSGQAIFSGLAHGDYLEVISAHGGRPRIRVAQTIKSARVEEVERITTIVQGIRGDFLSDARMSTALALALKRLEDTCTERHFKDAVVIVFSNGALSNDDAENVIQLADRFQEHGWGLYFTGTSTTNRKLLVASSQKRLHWSLISQANPVVWLAQRQQALHKERPAPAKIEQDGSAAIAPARTDPVANTMEKEETGTSDYRIRTSFNVDVSSPAASDKPPVTRTEALETTRSEEAGTDAVPMADAPGEAAKQQPGLWQSFQQRLRRMPGKALLWILPLLLGLAAAIAVLFSRGFRKARQWSARTNTKLQTGKKEDAGILVIRFNDQTYRLGRPDKVKAVHIGSGEKTTVRIADKSLSARHLCIYRRGNSLMLKNLSHTPVVANSNIVKPRHTANLVIPSVIKLNERVKLNLDLLKPQPSPRTTDNRSARNEPKEK